MTRKEEIEQKAQEISKIAFPDEHNIWARPNFEANVVNSCCASMAEWADKTMLDNVCEWLKCNLPYSSKPSYQIIEDLRKAMENNL